MNVATVLARAHGTLTGAAILLREAGLGTAAIEKTQAQIKDVYAEAIKIDDAHNAAIEAAAQIVDQCNREGPYNAIGAASRIRELKRGD
jgi:ElaB/YqjD/DUF883 family membrane-anchored ribosome-binding protein